MPNDLVNRNVRREKDNRNNIDSLLILDDFSGSFNFIFIRVLLATPIDEDDDDGDSYCVIVVPVVSLAIIVRKFLVC